MLRARVAGVPDEVLCDQTEESRATLNRRYGPRKAMTVTWTGDNLEEVQALRPDARLNEGGDLEVERGDAPGTFEVVGVNCLVRYRDQSPA